MCRSGESPKSPKNKANHLNHDAASQSFYVLQYSRGGNGFAHTIIESKDIAFPLINLKVGRLILFKYQEKHYKGVILLIDSLMKCKEHLASLCQNCHAYVAKSNEISTSLKILNRLERFTWYLTSFSKDRYTSCYAIMNIKDFEWRGKNYTYPYVSDHGKLYEIKLLKSSNEFHDILKVFRGLRGLNGHVPKSPIKGFQACMDKAFESQENKALQFYYHYLNMDESQEISRTLNYLEKKKRIDQLLMLQETKSLIKSVDEVTKILSDLQIST